MAGERVRPFRGHDERRDWRWVNCVRCQRSCACILDVALDGDSVPAPIAARLGYVAGQPLGPCPERQEAQR